MADNITGFQTADGVKRYDYNALANKPTSVTDVTNTVISPNADYAEVGEWADGNPGAEDRLGYFVAVAEVGDNTIKIRKATSDDDVRGVSVYNPAFSGNASKDKYGADGELLAQYNYIGVMGIVKVIDKGRCTVNGRCMPGDDGTAIPSTNNMGYAVLERVDALHVLIAVEPGADMIQRVKSDIEDIEAQIKNGGGGGGGIATETDPTVPSWAKQKSKPSYSKSEVGLGNVDNVKQYSASNPPPYPVTSVNGKAGAVSLGASDVGARPDTWTPSYSDVGADKSGAAASAVSSHNTNASAHNDIRLLIEGLTTRINALANSTDEDLDQMAEIVAYIKANKALIEQVTTAKVSVTDIVDNLATNVTNKPLSAAQGVALKALIDAIEVPTKLSELTGDATHRTVTDSEKMAWNAKLGQSDLQAATNAALAQAKESGEFDGKDYVLTDADKDEIADIVEDDAKGDIVQSILAELQGLPVFGVVDESKNIKLTSMLPDGKYVMGYGNDDGTFTPFVEFIWGTPLPTYVNILPTAKTPTDLTTVFNGGKGYMDGKYASSASPYYGDDSSTFVTGLIESAPDSVFYIKGVTIDTSNSHNRLGVFNEYSSPDAVKPFTQMTDYATLETLGTQYYKLTMNVTFPNFKYIMFSAMGSGANCIISTTPIEE